MADEAKSVAEDERDALLKFQEAITNRLQNLSREERLEVESLSQRAIHPQCSFDRKHSQNLYKMALFPESVSSMFKLRERIHRVLHHH